MKYLGRAVIAWDGNTLDTLPGATIDHGGVTNKVVKGSHTIGSCEEFEPGIVECEINISADTTEEDIKSIYNATVTFRGDIGKTWMIRNAFYTGSMKMTAGEGGKCKVVLTGDPAEAA
ncbi:MAG: phage tail tube protein [Rhodospirillaceae bacterium]